MNIGRDVHADMSENCCCVLLRLLCYSKLPDKTLTCGSCYGQCPAFSKTTKLILPGAHTLTCPPLLHGAFRAGHTLSREDRRGHVSPVRPVPIAAIRLAIPALHCCCCRGLRVIPKRFCCCECKQTGVDRGFESCHAHAGDASAVDGLDLPVLAVPDQLQVRPRHKGHLSCWAGLAGKVLHVLLLPGILCRLTAATNKHTIAVAAPCGHPVQWRSSRTTRTDTQWPSLGGVAGS